MKISKNRQYQKVIIIGAPRSGTNILRDVLCSLDGISTWPCDEINYIWRHGNVMHPSDEIPASRASDIVLSYIRHKFDLISRDYDAEVVVEKTCANSLRVPFVDAVVPDAKYIFIYRDVIDVVSSAECRWTADMDLRYMFRKLPFIPKTDIFYYGLRYFFSRVYRLFSPENRVMSWGPKYTGQLEHLKTRTLSEACALQWAACVDSALTGFSLMPKDKVIKLKYEDFISNPDVELGRILAFLGRKVTVKGLQNAVVGVRSDSVGKGRKNMPAEDIKKLEDLVSGVLDRLR